ncbi:MAG TPA: family 10 glycosylhydrolase [Bryobacteraceae bacterium]|nr:family 10 glycosylhydrolase [Bryobacteraceae bacterium]
MRIITVVASLVVLCRAANAAQQPQIQDWSHYVRIAGHGLSHQSIPNIIRESQASHVFGIEVDNDVPGRYESFLDPAAKLAAIKQAAQAAHAIGNKSFVYIAGLECITANADKTKHTFFKDHPDWVQRDRNGKPAVFGGGTAFWIAKGDEDVWISPYAPEWRRRYMQIVREIAATGIDGVYVDIPYWMTHFEGWEKSWASFDKYTVDAFRRETGIDALHDMRLGDATDPHFRSWVDFRIRTITDFMREIDKNVKAANPKCLTIAEIYPGYESAAPRVGADVYELYPVVDTIAHEYQGPADTIAASRSALDWVRQMIGIFTFRAFAGDKPSWMLNYSWDGEKGVSVPEAMKTMFASHLTAGANTWDARGHVMSGSNDMAVRTEVFGWIAKHEHTFYDARTPILPVGVYFSPATRNYWPDKYVPRFRAAMELLLLSHREFQIVTPRTVSSFRGSLVIVPGKSLLSTDEQAKLRFLKSKTLDLDNDLARFDSWLLQTFTANAETGAYASEMQKEIAGFSRQIPADTQLTIQTSPFVISQVARVNGRTHIFLMNLKGIEAKRKLLPDAETGTSIELAVPDKTRAFVLPFLGDASEVSTNYSNGKLQIRVPPFQRSIVIWFEDNATH